ncbi:MAG TPA: M23 family metallopeptidase [Vicinamibacteria bacterium]|nr:M23 family metallopeptidase [Vicinamibacteria bacterium]
MRRPFGYLLAAALSFVLLFVLFWPGPAPSVDVRTDRPGVGRAGTGLSVTAREPARGVSSIRVEALQADRVVTLADQSFVPRSAWAVWKRGEVEPALELRLSPETIPGLSEGDLLLRMTAKGSGSALIGPRETTSETVLPVRLTAPVLGLTSSQNYAAQGGSGVVVYRVGDVVLEEGGLDGVEAGSWFFRGYPLPGGQATERFALYGVPYDLPDDSKIRLVASDAFGNTNSIAFVERFFPRPLKSDTIQLSVEFMEKVVPEIIAQTPDLADRGDLLQNYLAINGELRARNTQTLRELGSRSRPSFLWTGPFDQLPNSQVTSAFADRRTYHFEGRDVDRQDHLGFDLASVRGAPVPAANRGVVILARYLGIYGNTVVVDHGFGLMSLYSHLSAFDVSENQEVEKAQVLGRTGQTGLAGGDHLHFTLLVHGLAVNPIEWWDPAWIRDRITAKLERGDTGS